MNYITKIIIIFLSFLVIILLPVFLIVWQYELFFPKTDNIDHLNYQEKVMAYLLNKDELPSEMTYLEASHMNDVRILITYSNFILLFSLLICCFLYIYLKKKKQLKLFYYSLKISSISITILIIVLFFLSIFNFNWFFNVFHEIFFPQGNWLFPANSKMIQVFPETLFKNLFIYSLLMSFIISLLILLVSFITKKIKHKL